MNTKDLIRLGVPVGEPIRLAHEFIQNFIAQGNDGALLEGEIFNIVANPPAFFADELRAPLARAIYRPAFTPRAELPLRQLRSDRSAVGREALPRSAFAPWRQWGEGLEAEAVKQMANACALPSRPSPSLHFSPPPPRRWRARSCRMRTWATACRSAACSRRTTR
jgi:tRNA-splicing ligase RtcB